MIFLLWLLIIVASLADAWIKTTLHDIVTEKTSVASLVDAWIKMILDQRRIYHGQVASLADVWIKTPSSK